MAAIFLLGWALLDYPLLSLFDRPGDILGMPILYAYLFAAWLLLIVLMGVVARERGD